MEADRTIAAHSSYVLGLRFTADGRSLYSAGMDNVVHLWETDSWRRLATFAGHDKSVNCMLLTPNENALVTGSSDTTVRIWDVKTQTTRHILQDRKRVVAALALSPDGTFFAAGSYKGRVAIWDIDGNPITAFVAAKGNVATLAFPPDRGNLLATGGLGPEIKIWSVPESDLKVTLTAETVAFSRIRFTPDARYLMGLSYEGHMHIWDTERWRRQPELEADLVGARAIAVNPSGEKCAVLYPGRFEIRRTLTWDLVQEISVSAKVLYAAAFSPEQDTIAIAAADGRIRIYTLS